MVQMRSGIMEEAKGRLNAWLSLGFRPFYSVASAWAAVSVPLWVAQALGYLPQPPGHWGVVWHAHEMIFGYALAVLIGFLLTAGRNWSGQATPTGAKLAGLLALWVAARVAMWAPWIPLSAALNVATAWVAAACLRSALQGGINRRNDFFPWVLVAMGAGSAIVHWQGRAFDGLGLGLGLNLLVFVMALMAGRVIPMFTQNGIPGLKVQTWPWVEKVAMGSVLLVLVAEAWGARGPWLGAVLLLAALSHALRSAAWRPWQTTSNPMVWVLHMAYAWLWVHLALKAWVHLGWAGAPSLSVATHALTVGALGLLTLGMMARTARGHTGRLIQASALEVFAFSALGLCALMRVLGPWLWPSGTTLWWALSGLAWFSAYAAFLWVLSTWVWRPSLLLSSKSV